jgi:hypothetical protein
VPAASTKAALYQSGASRTEVGIVALVAGLVAVMVL